MTAMRAFGGFLAASSLLFSPPVRAQTLGTFSWQVQPYCNVVTLNVVAQGTVFTVDGFDDQCGAPRRAPLLGVAAPNPDGTIGLGLHVVTVPGGRGLQIDARISPATLAGPWTDSAGNSGTFVFGAATGGSPRPAPTIPSTALAPGSITAAQLAPGAVGLAQLAPGLIGTVAQARVGGTCASGQAMRGIGPDGSVACTDLLTAADASIESVGTFTSIAIGADGFPVVSHYNFSATGLRVTHCGNAACSNGNVSTTVDGTATSSGAFTSLAIGVDGLPVISHGDSDVAGLRVTHCGNVQCTSGTTSTTVDAPANGAGQFTSIAIGVDGLPVISHQEIATGALRVTHCGNATCTSGNVSTTVDDQANSVGWYTSIAIGADGLPVISHQDNTSKALRVTHCGNATCTAGNVSTSVDDPRLEVGEDSSIAIGVDGLPIISHHDATTGGLRITHCGNLLCTSGNVSSTVDDPGNTVGRYSSIAIGAGGLPIISHFDATAGALRVTRCGNVACTSGNVSAGIDDPGQIVGMYTSIAIAADGTPVISHFDLGNGALRVAKCGTPTCQ